MLFFQCWKTGRYFRTGRMCLLKFHDVVKCSTSERKERGRRGVGDCINALGEDLQDDLIFDRS